MSYQVVAYERGGTYRIETLRQAMEEYGLTDRAQAIKAIATGQTMADGYTTLDWDEDMSDEQIHRLETWARLRTKSNRIKEDEDEAAM